LVWSICGELVLGSDLVVGLDDFTVHRLGWHRQRSIATSPVRGCQVLRHQGPGRRWW
jgi:hypothetical protein